jgi:hypothetical protein
MENTKYLLLVVIAILLSMLACTTQQTVVETVIVEVTSTPLPTDKPEPTPTPTYVPELDLNSFRVYTQAIFTDMYGSCVGLSRKDWATTNFTINLMDRAQAAECVRLISEHEIPLNCEYDAECNQLSSLAIEYTALITEGWKQFKKGESTLSDELISEGLGMFWDAEELWVEIVDVIFGLEEKYGWEIT